VKTRTTLLIDKEVLQKARELGLNVSKCCENALKLYIKAMESVTLTNGGQITEGKDENRRLSLVDGAGFEPAASTMPTWRSFHADLPAQLNSD
jgi:hypothetical protein